MTEDITGQGALFSDLLRRPVVVTFDPHHGSSDGGAILLRACDERLRLSERLKAEVARLEGRTPRDSGRFVVTNRGNSLASTRVVPSSSSLLRIAPNGSLAAFTNGPG